MSWLRLLLPTALVGLGCGCSAAFDNSRYYAPTFRPNPEPVLVCPYRNLLVNAQVGWVVEVNHPARIFPCSPPDAEGIYISPAGRLLVAKWRETDGGGANAGTNYSMRTLFPDERERDQERFDRFRASAYYAPEDIKEQRTFQHNGLVWEHIYVRELTRYPQSLDGRGAGPNPPPGPARPQRLRDEYIYKHPEGWWLRVRATFRPEMENFPEILASRRDTLRQVVESIRIEPKDPSRVSCRTDDRGHEFCRYRWP